MCKAVERPLKLPDKAQHMFCRLYSAKEDYSKNERPTLAEFVAESSGKIPAILRANVLAKGTVLP